MILVLCHDPLQRGRPDRAFEAENNAIKKGGIPYVLINFDNLVSADNPTRAVQSIPEQPAMVQALYRGWMMTPRQYERLYEALLAKRIHLINNPVEYRTCHYLPESYPAISEQSPSTVWLTGDLGIDRIMSVLSPFGDAPVVVKDFVKSHKHEWAEACFIPSASDKEAVTRVVGRFLELQGDDLNEGLVFREFVKFRPIGSHPKSGMPLTEEYRIFWLNGLPIHQSPYWETGQYAGVEPPISEFAWPASKVGSRFFSMDVARRIDGEWLIVELGDGQVTGLPKETDAEHFYDALRRHIPNI